MSKITPYAQAHFAPYLQAGKTLLELFPGYTEGEYHQADLEKQTQSVRFFYRRLHTPVLTLSKDGFQTEWSVHTHADIPPYPTLDKQVDYIALSEPFTAWEAEFSKSPKKGLRGEGILRLTPDLTMRFVEQTLRPGGKILLSNRTGEDMDAFMKYLRMYGKYLVEAHRGYESVFKDDIRELEPNYLTKAGIYGDDSCSILTKLPRTH